MSNFEVNGLPLPKLLIELLEQGRWKHPGEAVILRHIPYFQVPIEFLQTVEKMRFESSGHLADDPQDSKLFHSVRGSKLKHSVELPWLDVDNSFFVAVNQTPGDDIGIALDYRTNWDDPRVVASNWFSCSDEVGCIWEEVFPKFSQFVKLLAL